VTPRPPAWWKRALGIRSPSWELLHGRPRGPLVQASIDTSNRNRVWFSCYWSGRTEVEERWGFDVAYGNGNSDAVWNVYVEADLPRWLAPWARRLEYRTEERSRRRWADRWRWDHEWASPVD
jgi:hypothetical protein